MYIHIDLYSPRNKHRKDSHEKIKIVALPRFLPLDPPGQAAEPEITSTAPLSHPLPLS